MISSFLLVYSFTFSLAPRIQSSGRLRSRQASLCNPEQDSEGEQVSGHRIALGYVRGRSVSIKLEISQCGGSVNAGQGLTAFKQHFDVQQVQEV
jgi:hypothetical protein